MIEDLNLLRVFYYVAKTGQISKAAELLNVSQPAISQQIKTLENQVRFKLFFRSKKGVKLTNDAQEIYSYCKSIFASVESINHTLQNISSLDSGTLRIGASDTICKYYLIDKLKVFEQTFPQIRYRVTNCITAESLDLLKNNDVDIAFVHFPVSHKQFTFQPCLTLEDFFVCSYDFDCSKIKSLSDLTKYRTLLLEKSSHSRKFLDANLFRYNIRIICVSRQYIKKELENKELKIIDLKEKLDTRSISLAYDKNTISKAAKRFMEML